MQRVLLSRRGTVTDRVEIRRERRNGSLMFWKLYDNSNFF